MPSEITAERLNEMVSQWPEEARPISFLRFPGGGRRAQWFDSVGNDVTLENAIGLHIASGIKWLIAHENTDAMTIIPEPPVAFSFRIELDLFRDPASRNRNDLCTRTFDAPTLIEALSAAIKEASK